MIKKIRVIFMICCICSVSYAGGPKATQKFKIIEPVYLIGVYDSLNRRTLSKSTAKAYLHSKKYAKKAEVAFQTEVPIGTVMTIIGPASKPWYMRFYADQYFIKLDPDPSQGLDIIFQINRVFEGNLDGLNSEIFQRDSSK